MTEYIGVSCRECGRNYIAGEQCHDCRLFNCGPRSLQNPYAQANYEHNMWEWLAEQSEMEEDPYVAAMGQEAYDKMQQEYEDSREAGEDDAGITVRDKKP